jgi:multicomponent Na+:H+ antiporter subunit D
VTDWAHPAWPLLVGALLAAALPTTGRRLVVVLAPAAALALAWGLPGEGERGGTLIGLAVVWLRADALARVFAIVFALITLLGGIYALATPRRRLLSAALAAAAAAEGVVLAGDWVTLYLAWETLALASFILVGDGGAPRAWRAALRYLLVHAAGGACLLAGIVWHRASGGGSSVGALDLAGPGLLVLVAFAVNAAIPPLHAWLTDAYPESAPAGGVFLSAFATKSAVYALARVFAGEEALVWAGVTMALYGVVFATIENDIRRLLGYHIVSQVGYMVAGIGIGSPLALAGAAAHAFCHILYKGLLFMGTGAIVHATGRRTLTTLGGLAGAMPWTLVLYMVGALSISGAPLLNGFVSKSMVVAAAEADHRAAVVWLLQLAAVGTFLSTGLKLPWFTWGGPARGAAPAPVPRAMLAAMALTAGLCALTGMAPGLLYTLLPFAVGYTPYTAGHVLESLQLLAGTLGGFLLLRAWLAGQATVTLDFDRLYRWLGRLVVDGLAPRVAAAADWIEASSCALLARSPAVVGPVVTGPVGYAVLVALAALGLALLAF